MVSSGVNAEIRCLRVIRFLRLRLVLNWDGVQTAKRNLYDVDAVNITHDTSVSTSEYSSPSAVLYAINTVVKLVPPAVRLLVQLVVFRLE